MGKSFEKKFNSLEALFKSYEQERLSNVVTVDNYRPTLDDIRKNGERPAISTGIRSVDDLFKWYYGFVYCFTGYPGSGKSEFLNFLAMKYSANTKEKVALYSPEAYPVEGLLVSLVQARCEKYYKLIPDGEWSACLDFLHENFYFVTYKDIPMSHDILNVYAELREKGVRMFITDPFNYLADMSGSGMMSQNLNAALSRMKQFAVDYDCLNLIIEHPRSPILGKDGSLPEPSPWQLYGGSMWWNKMDVIASLQRPIDDSNNSVLLKTWKVKNQRVVGKKGQTELLWDYGVYRESSNTVNDMNDVSWWNQQT